MKRFLLLISMVTSLAFARAPTNSIAPISSQMETPLYSADFENVSINNIQTVDKVTGFIWANDYQNTHTIEIDNNNLLYWSVLDSSQYSIVGGFGIGANDNLSRLKKYGSYHVTSYLKMFNIEKLYVEVIGEENKWGSIIIDENGMVESNPGGNNIVDVSYQNDVLNFTFTMSYVNSENQNGYIKITAYNSQNGYIFLDNVGIYKAKYAMDDTLEQYPLGLTNLDDFYTPFYIDPQTNVTAQFIKKNDSMVFEASYQSQDNSSQSVFFINDLGFIIQEREYTFTFDLDTENISQLYIYFGGTWLNSPSYLELNVISGMVSLSGNQIKSADYSNGKISIVFVAPSNLVMASDWTQFQFIAETINSSLRSVIEIDNLRFALTPIIEGISVDTSQMKTTYEYGSALDTNGLKVYKEMSDENFLLLNNDEFSVVGFDSTKEGICTLSVNYKTFKTTFNVIIVRTAISLRLDTSAVPLVYDYGTNLDLANLRVFAQYNDTGNEKEILHNAIINGYTIGYGGFDPFVSGTYTIIIFYKDLTAYFTVNINAATNVDFSGITYTSTGK